MNKNLKAWNRFSEEPAPGLEEKSRKEDFPDGYTVAGLIRGRAASPGVATGRAAIIRGKKDLSRVGEGAVIVSEKASPDLAMVMSKACAMVTEYGGATAIASGYAREHAIPAVVSVAGLTTFVRDGDLLRVDGTRGIVQLLVPNI
jgi:pyruvate,water dikinase